MAATSRRERLYEVFADPDLDVDEKVDRALDVGTASLDLPIGFFTRIEDGTQTILRATGDHDLIRPGETCPLREAYCRRTVEVDGPLAIQDVSGSEIPRRAVETFGLGAYLGAPVTVDGETYGTVCFAGDESRDEPFSEAEELFIEVLANLLGTAIERREYERHLRERTRRLEREKHRFEGIAENSFDILFRLDRAARFTYVSSAVERVLDFEPAALTGEHFADFVTEAATRDALDAYRRVLDGESVESLELDFLDRAGDVVAVEVNATPITEEGELTGVHGVGRDVTDRKERERKLRVRTRAMDEAGVGITIADPTRPDDPLVYVNDGFERITGYDEASALGRNCRFLQGERTDSEAVAQLREAVDAGESASVELLNYRRDGTPFWNRVQVDPVFDERGELTHYLGFQRDVTERKRTEQLVRLLNRVLRHNLRNDMTAVLGWAGALQDGAVEGAAALGARIEGTSRGLVDLSEHARALERYARRDRDPRRLDPRDLLGGVAADHRERFPDATVEVDVRTDRAICAGPELRQAVAELVENGLKHDPSAAPCVRVTAVDDGEWVDVAVADDGPGLADQERAVIETGAETALVHGSGLGLWMTNWIVTRYGGSFQVEAGPAGTTATVRLPAVDADTPVASAARGPAVLLF